MEERGITKVMMTFHLTVLHFLPLNPTAPNSVLCTPYSVLCTPYSVIRTLYSVLHLKQSPFVFLSPARVAGCGALRSRLLLLSALYLGATPPP